MFPNCRWTILTFTAINWMLFLIYLKILDHLKIGIPLGWKRPKNHTTFLTINLWTVSLLWIFLGHSKELIIDQRANVLRGMLFFSGHYSDHQLRVLDSSGILAWGRQSWFTKQNYMPIMRNMSPSICMYVLAYKLRQMSWCSLVCLEHCIFWGYTSGNFQLMQIDL